MIAFVIGMSFGIILGVWLAIVAALLTGDVQVAERRRHPR